jgi:hypothetical protein
MGQHLFINIPLKPSGPGALSRGKSEISPSISLQENSLSRTHNCTSCMRVPQIKQHQIRFRLPQSILERVPHNGCFMFMINYCGTILQLQLRDIISPEFLSGNCLKKLSVLITKLHPSNCGSLLPVGPSSFQQGNEMRLKKFPEVSLNDRERPLFL